MSALPTIKQLQYLVAVSESLNFTRAAESCFVTQSTLSAGLKELETNLDAQLIERDRKNVLMTSIGRKVVERARTILTDVHELTALTAAASDPMAGELKFGVIPTIAPFLLPGTMMALRKQYPDLQLILREDMSANLLSRLKDGRLDIALMALPYDTENFLVQPLFDDEFYLIGRRGDLDNKSSGIKVSESISEKLLLLEEGHCLRDHTLFACQSSRAKQQDAVEATSLLTLVQMVESGLGIAMVPALAIDSGFTKGLDLATRTIAKPAPKRTIVLVARQSTALRDVIDALAALITQVAKDL